MPVALVAMICSCASMGRPEGGPRDLTPPVPLHSTPAQGELNVSTHRLRVYFDENVQIKDAMQKVVVSPVQKTPPSISAVGRYVQVEFRDTLIPDMTYTIDFADAISDLNESNVLDGFATDFSTGSTIDTLRISGMVFQASNLEPAQGMIVGVYSNLADSAISTLPFERITKTNQLGQFTIRNLKPGNYHIFAVNDQNRDYHWDRSEDIAFYDTIVSPTAHTVTVSDTLRASDGTDSIVSRTTTEFLPNDLLLTWFNENYRAQYLAKNERPERRRIHIELGAPSDTFPTLRVLSGERNGLTDDLWSVRTASATRDTLDYWINDTLVSGLDSLLIEARYQRIDSLDQLVWTTDTLRMFLRGNNTRKAELKREAQEAEKRRKAMEKGDTIPLPPPPFINFTLAGTSTIDVHRPVTLTTQQPLIRLDSSAVHLEIKVDTLWHPAPAPEISWPRPYDRSILQLSTSWEPGAVYRITVDSAAAVTPWEIVNKPFTQELKVHALEDYSSITFEIHGLPDSVTACVELLSKQDMPVDRQPVVSGEAVFKYLIPSEYYARLFIDANGNGRYDDGNLALRQQPEEIFYYPKRIKLKKNWDVRQTWDIFELPLDMQKPIEIKKNKPAKKKGEEDYDRRNGYGDDEEDEDEMFGNDDFFNPGRNNRNSNRYPTNSRPGYAY